MIASSLLNYEIIFRKIFQDIEESKRKKPGALLPFIPGHEQWDEFLEAVKKDWATWRESFEKYPSCLIVLYGGLAFYEYDENTLWPQFAKAVGTKALHGYQQSEINTAFARAAEAFGLKINRRDNRTDYIGSAVFHIGIPLSLWDGFLEICEWARWRDDWKTLTDEQWRESIGKCIGGRIRLRNFLIYNREAASTFIQEMHDVREIILNEKGNKDFNLSNLKEACLLRPEYFDGVPETAEFLREDDPESLFQDRARLIWDTNRSRISLYLPAVALDKLPATWKLGTLSQESAATSDIMPVNSAAFNSPLHLKLESESQCESQRLRGLNPWGLFDLERGGHLINSDREQLPLRSYILISKEKIENINRKGFEEEENPVNEQIELEDGKSCYVTRLWPTGKFAELTIKHDNRESKIRFRTKSKIEAQLFYGRGKDAAYFSRVTEDKVKLIHLPILCLVIPHGYFDDNEKVLNNKFRVFLDDRPAFGKWENCDNKDDEKEFFIWNWDKKPFFEKIKSGTTKNFKELKNFYRSPNLKGDRILSIEAPEFRSNHKIYLDNSRYEIQECWKNLPGAFLPWFLLCQSNEGMKWDNLMLAKDIIAPEQRISYYLLKKYADYGLLKQQGRLWMIGESRSTIQDISDDVFLLQYCGNPSILWGLYRKIYYRVSAEKLPIVEVINKKGGVPYLQMSWASYLKRQIEKYLQSKGVYLGSTLWTH